MEAFWSTDTGRVRSPALGGQNKRGVYIVRRRGQCAVTHGEGALYTRTSFPRLLGELDASLRMLLPLSSMLQT